MRLLLSSVVLLVFVGSAVAEEPDRFGDGGLPEFYRWTENLPAPGTLLRSEPLQQNLVLTEASRGERILYASTDGLNDSKRVPVSGALFWPKGDPPEGGWPIVAWAHGTVGVADRCSPSFAGRSDRDKQYLNAWLSAGFAVVATDYQGLGTAGGHPYLATKPEAYGVLDSIRAVRNRLQIGDTTIIVGQSQGAGAAFATAAFHAAYAPDVKLLGTVATGVPYFSKETLAALARSGNVDGVSPTLAYTLLILQLAEQALPNFDAASYLTDRGRTVYEMARTSCLAEMEKAIVDGEISRRMAFSKDPAPVIDALFPQLAYPSLRLGKPLFVGTGEADRDVPPPMQAALVRDACAAGTHVVWRRYPGLDHGGTVNASLTDSLPFVRSLLAGTIEPVSCQSSAETPAGTSQQKD